jgi:rhodanese-related sulfurtransferase
MDKKTFPNPQKAKEYFQNKMAFTTGPVTLNKWTKERKDINIVDVRRAEDYAAGHIPGAINIPAESWNAPSHLSKDHVNIMYCYSQTCHLAAEAAALFAEQGYPVMEMEGGFEAWQNAKFPVEKQQKEKTPEVVSVGRS